MRAERKWGAIMVLYAVVAPFAWTQTPPPGGARQPGIAKAPAPGPQPNQGMTNVQRMEAERTQRLQVMEDDLRKMHALLDDMRKKVDTAGSAKSVMTDNVQLWETMLGYVDRSLAQARMAMAPRSLMTGAGGSAPGTLMPGGALPVPKASGTPSARVQPVPKASPTAVPPSR